MDDGLSSTTPKYRRPLNDEQLEVLELLYKFRFGSNILIAAYFGKNHRAFVSKRLKILQEQGLIGKHFDSSYRIQGKPASYYLLSAGARKLQEARSPEDEAVNIKRIYKDKTASGTFIQHSLNIFTTYSQLKLKYGGELAFFTKTDLASYTHFPKPLPDAFVSLEAKNNTQHFFVEVIEDNQPFFTALRRAKKYLDHKERGEWAVTEVNYPAILIICESTSLQKRLQKQLARILNASWVNDINFATTTWGESTSLLGNDVIWQVVTKSEEKLPLQDI